MPKQVSGFWFHGFLGLSHVTFSAWSSSVLDLIPRPCATLNSVWVAVVGFCFFFSFFFWLGVGRRDPAWMCFTPQNILSRTYYSGWNGQISEVNEEEKMDFMCKEPWDGGGSNYILSIWFSKKINKKNKKNKKNTEKKRKEKPKLDVWWMGWCRKEEKVWVSSPADGGRGRKWWRGWR